MLTLIFESVMSLVNITENRLTTSASNSILSAILRKIDFLNLPSFKTIPCKHCFLALHYKNNEERMQHAHEMKQKIKKLWWGCFTCFTLTFLASHAFTLTCFLFCVCFCINSCFKNLKQAKGSFLGSGLLKYLFFKIVKFGCCFIWKYMIYMYLSFILLFMKPHYFKSIEIFLLNFTMNILTILT